MWVLQSLICLQQASDNHCSQLISPAVAPARFTGFNLRTLESTITVLLHHKCHICAKLSTSKPPNCFVSFISTHTGLPSPLQRWRPHCHPTVVKPLTLTWWAIHYFKNSYSATLSSFVSIMSVHSTMYLSPSPKLWQAHKNGSLVQWWSLSAGG